MQNLHNQKLLQCQDFGSDGLLQYPSLTVVDNMIVSLNMINNIKALLKTDDVLLCQSDAWSKIGKDDYTSQSNNNQRIHMDYGNNTFMHPPDWY